MLREKINRILDLKIGILMQIARDREKWKSLEEAYVLGQAEVTELKNIGI